MSSLDIGIWTIRTTDGTLAEALGGGWFSPASGKEFRTKSGELVHGLFNVEPVCISHETVC